MKHALLLFIVLLVFSCKSSTEDQATESKSLVDKESIHFYKLENANGIKVTLMNYGARIVSVITPDKDGDYADIALGYNTVEEYLNDKIYSGPLVGRYANRIKEGKFTLDGKEYQLKQNEGENAIHGGLAGFDKKIWTATQEGNSVRMSYTSPDMEEGYPGKLKMRIVYTLTDEDELKMEYFAETDKATILNLTNHTLWNLKGEGDTTILDHYFMINADSFVPVDTKWIPTGEILAVEGTALDFRKGKQIGEEIYSGDQQIENALGFDHNWNLNKALDGELSLAGKLWEKTSGRMLEIYTTEPGLQFYSGNFLDGSVKGKSGKPYQYRSALIFEAQHYPDAPNNPDFPSSELWPEEDYYQQTIIKFALLQ